MSISHGQFVQHPARLHIGDRKLKKHEILNANSAEPADILQLNLPFAPALFVVSVASGAFQCFTQYPIMACWSGNGALALPPGGR